MQELDQALVEYAHGKSLVAQRRDIVLGRHCVPLEHFRASAHLVVKQHDIGLVLHNYS